MWQMTGQPVACGLRSPWLCERGRVGDPDLHSVPTAQCDEVTAGVVAAGKSIMGLGAVASLSLCLRDAAGPEGLGARFPLLLAASAQVDPSSSVRSGTGHLLPAVFRGNHRRNVLQTAWQREVLSQRVSLGPPGPLQGPPAGAAACSCAECSPGQPQDQVWIKPILSSLRPGFPSLHVAEGVAGTVLGSGWGARPGDKICQSGPRRPHVSVPPRATSCHLRGPLKEAEFSRERVGMLC